MAPLSFLTVAPSAKHTATVVFAHGLGDSGAGWLPVARMLSSALPHVKWILPNAPEIPITLNHGMSMPGWFDLSSLEKLADPAHEDRKGLVASANALQALVAQHSLDLDPRRVVVGGFSQGCAIALLAGLTKGTEGREKEVERNLAGVVALSGWLPLRTSVKEELHSRVADLPLFWGHGKADQVVAYDYGKRSTDALVNELGMSRAEGTAGKGVRFESYAGLGHGSSPQEIEHLKAWLKEVLPPV